MKVIKTDNFNRENISDETICENVSMYWAERIARLLNEKEGESGQHFFKAVLDGHKLYKYEGD